ncbi:MAG: hypothetical protein LBL66_02325 [Clostridiales bacterium]|nr:hypothetical protein [Clostridiales bacterium]
MGILHFVQNDRVMHNSQFTIHNAQFRNERGMRASVPLFGRDCRVALRAPRNDMPGVRAPCNDMRGVRAPRNKSNDRGFARSPVSTVESFWKGGAGGNFVTTKFPPAQCAMP